MEQTTTNAELNHSEKTMRYAKGLKILNILTVITGIISLTLISIIIFISMQKYAFGMDSRWGERLFSAYAETALTISNASFFILVVVTVAMDIALGIIMLVFVSKSDKTNYKKMQITLAIINIAFGGMLFINAILASIILWKTKKSVKSALAFTMVPIVALAPVAVTTNLVVANKMNKPMDLLKEVSNSKIIKICKREKGIDPDVTIDLNEINKYMTKENMKQEFAHVSFWGEIMAVALVEQEDLIDAWSLVDKRLRELTKITKEKKYKAIHLVIMQDRNVEEIKISPNANKVINKVIRALDAAEYDIDFNGNLSLKRISGKLDGAERAQNIYMPKGVINNPYKKI